MGTFDSMNPNLTQPAPAGGGAPGAPRTPGAPIDFAGFFGGLWGHFRRAVKPSWGEGVATADERATLAASTPAVRGAQAQDYLAWRRSVLTSTFVLLSVGALYAFVVWCIDLAEELPAGVEQYFRRGLVNVITFILVAAQAFMAWMAWCALRRWSELGASHRRLRWGWLIGYSLPFVVAMVPGPWFFDFSGVPAENRAEVQRIEMVIGMLVGVQYFISLLPTVLSVLVGAIRSSLFVKRFVPESALPGWIAAAVAPVFVLILLTVFILLHQMSGNLVLAIGIALLALDYLTYLLRARSLARPHGRAELREVLAPVAFRTTVLGAGGIVFLVIALFTMKLGEAHIVGFAEEDLESPFKVLPLAIEFVGKALFTVLVFSDLIVALLRHAWTEAQAFRHNELAGALEDRLEQMAEAGVDSIRPPVGAVPATQAAPTQP